MVKTIYKAKMAKIKKLKVLHGKNKAEVII